MSKPEIKSPYEHFIINYLTRIHDSLDHLDYYTASVALQHCIYSLPPTIKEKFSDRGKELNDLIGKRNNLKASNLVHARLKQIHFDKTVISPFLLYLLSQVWSVLFTEGYITKPQYGRDFGSIDWDKSETQ